MTMVKTPIEVDTEALAVAAEVLGTKTEDDSVDAALREVGHGWCGCAPWPGSEGWRTTVTLISFSTTRRPTPVSPALYLVDTSGVFRTLQDKLRQRGLTILPRV